MLPCATAPRTPAKTINMKPIISNTDYNTLRSLVTTYPYYLGPKETGQLIDELNRAEIVDDQSIGKDIIRIDSYFEAEDSATKKILKLKLTLPAQANLKEQKLSVLSPLGVALIGYRKGMTVDWELPGGIKNIRILEVVNS